MANPLLIGQNSSPLGVSSTAQPFLNILKAGGGFDGTTTDGVRFAYSSNPALRDTNGYPTTMAGQGAAAGKTFAEFDITVNFGLTVAPGTTESYRSGKYVLLWDGAFSENNFNWSRSEGGGSDPVVVNSRQANRIVFTVTPGQQGIRTYIVGIAGGIYPYNIRLVYGDVINAGDVAATTGSGGSTTAGVNGTGTYEAQLNSGRVLGPDYLDRMSPFYIYRHMQNASIITTTAQSFSSWPTPTTAIWQVIPFEAMCAVCNELGQHAWICLPHQATFDFVTQAANIVLNGSTDNYGNTWDPLDSNLDVYMEHGNEIWQNNGSGLMPTATANGKILFPLWTSAIDAFRRYCTLKTVQHGKIWTSILGSSRCNVVQGGQVGNLALNEAFLTHTATQLGGLTFSGTGSISGNTLTIDPGVTGTVSPHQEISGTGVASPTYIVAQLTGTAGAAGTYSTSGDTQTVASTAMTGTYYTGTVASNVDYFAIAPYWQYSMPPQGTMSGAQTNGSTLSVGTTSIPLGATGTGTIAGNDRITFAGDATVYRVTAGTANVNGGTISIASPGLTQQITGAVAISKRTTTTDELFQEISYGNFVNPTSDFQVLLSCTASISGTTMTVTATSTGSTSFPVLYPGQEILTGAAAGTKIVTQLTSTTAFPSGRYGSSGTYQVNISQTVASTTMTLTSGLLAQAYAQTWAAKRTATSSSWGNGLPIVVYEAGQQFVAGSLQPTLLTLYLDFIRDSRLEGIYTEYYNAIQSIADPLFMINYNDANEQSNFGQWGSLENILATSSPRYDALVALAGNVTTTSAAIPMPLRLRLGLW